MPRYTRRVIWSAWCPGGVSDARWGPLAIYPVCPNCPPPTPGDTGNIFYVNSATRQSSLVNPLLKDVEASTNADAGAGEMEDAGSMGTETSVDIGEGAGIGGRVPQCFPLLCARCPCRSSAAVSAPLKPVPIRADSPVWEIGCGSGWLKVTNEDRSVYYMNEITKENTLVRGLFARQSDNRHLLFLRLVSRKAMYHFSALSPPHPCVQSVHDSSPFRHFWGGFSFLVPIESYRATRFPSRLRSRSSRWPNAAPQPRPSAPRSH